ncbi:acetyltransferase [Ciceribacter lividus]|uniref:acetyltransferase n=1 Tax=Ciceribacter lividus TaxID=1197950 RepID=UPI00247837C8|nr:acetyltransferase [Ciceribacter lividus]
MPQERRPVIIIGAGGHARVLQSSLEAMGLSVVGAVEKVGVAAAPDSLLEILGDEMRLSNDLTTEWLAIGVGAVPSRGATGLHIRRGIYETQVLRRRDRLVSIIDPSATIRGAVEIGHAAQILAGVTVQTGTRIGNNTVANTGCCIDHDCSIGNHTFVGPGAVLCGGVSVGEECFIGANATILPGISIGRNAVIAAGSTVTHDVPHDGYNPR